MGSWFDKMGVRDNLTYCASKAAVAAMSRCMAVEWARDGIKRYQHRARDISRRTSIVSFLPARRCKPSSAGRVPVERAGTVDEVARLVGALFVENIKFSDRRDDLHRWRAGDCALMKLFDKVARARRWSQEEQQILDQVQRMVDEVIAPNASRIDETGGVSLVQCRSYPNALGLNTIFVPEAYGGASTSFALYSGGSCQSSPEACASTGIIYATNFHGMKPLVDFGNEEQEGASSAAHR